MLDFTNSVSNDQKQTYNPAEKNVSARPTTESFSQTLASQNNKGESNSTNQNSGEKLQASFNKLLSGNASQEDISSMQNALFNSLRQALFTDTANTSAVLTQKETSFSGETTTTSETSNTFWEFVDSASTLSFGEDGLGLDDAFDAVNILNHIPIVSDIYKDATSQGKTDAAASVAGGYMFAGPVGALYSAANVVTEEITGSSILDNLITLGRSFLGDDTAPTPSAENVATAFATSAIDTAAKTQPAVHEFVTRNSVPQGE